jgi:hypothetical protein
MPITVTELRADIYNIMDNILKTVQPIEIERSGKKLRIVLYENQHQPVGKLNQLIARPDAITGSPEDFTHRDWSHEWQTEYI